jgi:hypothetical protein
MKHTLLVSIAFLLTACNQSSSPVQPDPVGQSMSPPASQELRLPSSDHGGRPLSATMTGAAEAPGPGDPDGTGTAVITLNHGQGEVCFQLTVANINPAIAAHIHEAPVGVPGPIVVPLTPPPTSGSSSGCVAVAPDLVKDILQNPEEYYVNVHNDPFKAGAIRGQLSK